MAEEYLSISDVCGVLRMSRSRIYGLQAERATNGFPTPIKLSPAKCGRVLFRRADVVTWIESHTKEGEQKC
jgi:predicted DNA-binding transcriptional regulator AlpA